MSRRAFATQRRPWHRVSNHPVIACGPLVLFNDADALAFGEDERTCGNTVSEKDARADR